MRVYRGVGGKKVGSGYRGGVRLVFVPSRISTSLVAQKGLADYYY